MASKGFRSRITKSGSAAPGDLIAHDANWRQHPPGQLAALREVLDGVGWVQGVVVSKRTNRILDGHARVEVARDRGEKTVPVTWVDLSEKEELAVLVSFDQVGSLATTNAPKLAALTEKLRKSTPALQAALSAAAADLSVPALLEHESADDDGPRGGAEGKPTAPDKAAGALSVPLFLELPRNEYKRWVETRKRHKGLSDTQLLILMMEQYLVGSGEPEPE